MEATINEKRCCKCGKLKPISEFYVDNAKNDGVSSQCMECLRAYQRERYKANKNKISKDRTELSTYTSRELALELRARGYVGKLLYTKEIDIAKL